MLINSYGYNDRDNELDYKNTTPAINKAQIPVVIIADKVGYESTRHPPNLELKKNDK